METFINFTCHLFLTWFAVWLVGSCICMMIATIAVWIREKKNHLAHLLVTLFFFFLLPFTVKFLMFCTRLLIG